jgi:hypothetical protein
MRRSKSSAIRSPQDRDREPLTINHRERLWDRRSEIATAPIGIFPPKKLEASPPADVPPWSQKPSSDKMRIHTQLHNRHHFPHNRDMRETGERHSTRVHLDDDADTTAHHRRLATPPV